jgi:hypothetical protein
MDMQRLSQALKAAHAAGDTAAATRLAQEIRRLQQQPAQEKDRSFLGALRYGLDAPLENLAETAQAIGYKKTGDFLSNLTEAPENYDPASAAFINEGGSGYKFSELPRAAVEQAGQFAGSIASRAGGVAAGGAIGGPIGAVVGGVAAPALFEGLQQLGGIANERARNNGREEPNREDWIGAITGASGTGVLNAIAPGLSGFLRRAAVEGGTEAIQSIIQQVSETAATDKGLEVSPKQAIGEGIIGSGSVAAVDVPTSAAVRFKSAFSKDGTVVNPGDLNDVEKQAAGDLARRFKDTSEANKFNLKNINKTDTKGARATVDMVHVQLTEDLRQRFNDMRSVIKPNDADTFESVRDKILVQAAYREGRNKTKSTVGQQEIDALVRLAGNTREGQESLNLLRQLNQLTELHNEGYQGSLSAFTDQFSILGSKVGYDKGAVAFERIARPMLSGGAAFSTGGASLPLQVGVSSTGRAIDKLRGNYSQVDKFVRQNQDNPGLQPPNAPSLRDAQAAQLAADEQAQLDADQRKEAMKMARREANLDLVKAGADPTPESPQDIMQMATGLDRSGVARVLRLIEATTENQATLKAIQDYRDSIAVGRKIDGKMLSPLIRMVNQKIKENPDYVERVREPVRNNEPDVQTDMPNMGSGGTNTDTSPQFGTPQFTTQENYNRGIEANRVAAETLSLQAQNDPELDLKDKAVVVSALDQLQFNLGSQPTIAAQAIFDQATENVNQDVAAKYIKPYVDRVMRQQRSNPVQASAEPGVAPETDTDTDLLSVVQRAMKADDVPNADDARIVPVPFNRADMQGIFGVNNPTPGGNYIDLDTKQDLTGNTYSGGTVSIVDGKPILETNDSNSAPATKADGRKVKVNLFKQKAGWKWLDYDGPNTIVSTEVGGKHHYALSSDFQTPVTLQTYPNQPSEPRLRPTTQGEVKLGNVIGNISVRGKEHPVYDKVSIVSKNSSLIDNAINPNIPLPKFEKTAALSPKTPVVHQQIKDPSGKTAYGLLPHLRTETKSFREGKPLFTLKTTNQNAEPQIKAIDEVLSRHPDPASSSEAWGAMLGDAFASKDIPVQPNGFIEDLNNGGAQELLSSLTPGQIADADHGFRNAEEFRRAYTNGEIGVEDTGRLFLWSFLSKGVSPYAQEGLFMDSFNGIDPWIKMAADGSLKDNMDGYKKWASTTAPKGSGQPGAGAMHNLNAFGKDFLLKMSQDAGKGDGRSRLQVIHDMMSDPDTTGKEIRREFMRLGEGVGIDNKVVSFTLLVAGYPDVMVLDRVQMRQMWNDGRFTGLNLYDGYKHNGDAVNGSGMALTSTGARGLLVYEAMERSLQNRLNKIYSDVGRPDAASVGRYHWETWVASSQQEASHGTIDAILARAKGDPNPLEGVTAKEGEYGAYAYGAKYGLENGVPMFTYDVPDRGTYKFTVPQFQSFLNDIKRKAKSNKVIPFGFSVQKSGNAPWYTREGVDLDALAEKAKQYGKQVSTTDEGIRQGQAVPDGRNTDAAVGRTDEQRVPVLTDRSNTNRGRSSATGVYANPLSKTNLRKIKEYIVKSRPAYQVGLKGGKLEDGIQDIEAALEVANSLGMTVRLFNSIDEMNDARREGGLPVAANSAGTFYRGISNFNTGGVYKVDSKAKGFEGTVFALNPGAVVNGEPITELDALTTILHEMSHGMTLGNMQLSELQNPNQEFFNPYNHDFDHAPVGSFARSAILPFIMESSPDVSKGVLKEIQDLQENLDVYTTNNPKERIAVRHIRSMFRRINDYESVGANRDTIVAMEEQALEYLQYTRNIRETSADPVWVYLLNPKLAKKLMPKTTALIRAEFDKAKNPKIQFFNHPFAVVAAVVAAMLAQGQEDEEREKQQQMMPPGALSPQQQMMAPGALTA